MNIDELFSLDAIDLEELRLLCHYGLELTRHEEEKSEWRDFHAQLFLIGAEQAKRGDPSCPQYIVH